MRIEYYIQILQEVNIHSRVTNLMLSRKLSKSVSFLERLMSELKKQDLVDSKLGVGGGYVLIKPYKSIKVNDLIPLIDERDEFCRVLAIHLRHRPISVLIDELNRIKKKQ